MKLKLYSYGFAENNKRVVMIGISGSYSQVHIYLKPKKRKLKASEYKIKYVIKFYSKYDRATLNKYCAVILDKGEYHADYYKNMIKILGKNILRDFLTYTKDNIKL